MRLAVAQYQQILVKLGILMALRCQNWPELSFAGDCLLPCYVCYVIKARGVPSFNVARCKTRLRDGSFFLSLTHTHKIFLFSLGNWDTEVGLWKNESVDRLVFRIEVASKSTFVDLARVSISFSCLLRSLFVSSICSEERNCVGDNDKFK